MRIALIVSSSLLVASAAAMAGDDPAAAGVPTRVAAAPPKAAPAAPPPLNAAGEGRRLFLKLNCYGCHGMFAAGAMGPDIVHAEHGDVQEAVMQGEDAGMPSFRKYVTATDIDNLTAYLKSIGGANEPVFMDWWKKHPKK